MWILVKNQMPDIDNGCFGFTLESYDELAELYTDVDMLSVKRGWIITPRASWIRDTSHELQAKRQTGRPVDSGRPASGRPLEPAPQDTSEAERGKRRAEVLRGRDNTEANGCGQHTTDRAGLHNGETVHPAPLTFIKVRSK